MALQTPALENREIRVRAKDGRQPSRQSELPQKQSLGNLLDYVPNKTLERCDFSLDQVLVAKTSTSASLRRLKQPKDPATRR